MRILIFLLLIMLPYLAPEEAISSHSDAPVSYGGTLYWATRNKPAIINPILTTSSVSMSLLDLIFNRLVRLNSKGEVEPDLAERWDVSENMTIYTFYLREGVRFHDGRECTADDVKFTYDTIMKEEVNSPFRPHFNIVKEVIVMDKYSLQIILKEPSNFFLYRLVREIVPMHILQGEDIEKHPFNRRPIGTGPFKFKEWARDDTITLEYNPYYYEGRPHLDKIVVKTYPTSHDVWTALMRGEVDYIEFIEKDDYEVMKYDPSFKVYAFPIDCYYAVSYNMDDLILADKRIRYAIAHAIDRKELIKRIASGYGLECAGPFYPGSMGFDPEVRGFEYDPEKSLKLLAQAGWHDADNDGIMEKDEEELEIRILVDSGSDIYRKIVMSIRQELQKIGIKIRVISYDNEEMLTREFLNQNRPQAYLKLFSATYPMTIAEHWSSKDTPRVNRLWLYRNEEVDRLFELGELSQDKKSKQELYRKIHELIYEDQPACFLYFPFHFHAVSDRFENVDDFFNSNMPYYTMKDWYVK